MSVACQADGHAGRIEEPQGQDGHIGHAVLKAAGKEGVETPEGHDQFPAVRLAAKAAPDGEADQDVAQDSPQEEDQRRQAHLSRRNSCQGLSDTACPTPPAVPAAP